MNYFFQVGETIRIPLILEEGLKEQITDPRANLKLTKGNKVDMNAPVAAVCEVIEANEGWILEVSADKTAVLKPGTYAVNAAMEVSGTTIITDPSFVRLEATTTF